MKNSILSVFSILLFSVGVQATDIQCQLVDSTTLVPVSLKMTNSESAVFQMGNQPPQEVVRFTSMKLSTTQMQPCADAMVGDLGEEEKCLASELGTQDAYQIEVARIFHWVSIHPPSLVVGFDTSKVASATGYFLSKLVPDGTGAAFVVLSDSKGQTLGQVMAFGFGVGAIVECK